LQAYSKLPYADLYASGTLALRAGILSANLKKGSGVGIPSFTCPDVLQAVVSAAHRPVVLDCDENGLLSKKEVLKALKQKKIRMAVAVHQFGLMNHELEDLCRLLPVLEDCSHVPPKAYLKGSLGVMGSFEGTKFLGAGEGGYLLLRQKPKDDAVMTLGNRMSDLLAVLAMEQLRRIRENCRKRDAIARQYRAALQSGRVLEGKRAAWFRFLIDLGSEKHLKAFIAGAARKKITVRRPIMPYPLHRQAGTGNCPHAEQLWKTLVSVPLYPDLNPSEIREIVSFLKTEKG
jgi:dTDP-4-amino-4,6-dideoxygalactose transaminase